MESIRKMEDYLEKMCNENRTMAVYIHAYM